MYLAASAIAAMPGEHRVHFLNAAAIRNDKSLGDAVGTKNPGVHLITVAPGDRSTEFHVHHYGEECIFVLSGVAKAVIGETRYRIGAGDFIGCPCNGIAYEMINDGSEPLVCLVIVQRLVQDITDYPRRAKRHFRHGGKRDLVAHGQIRPA